MPYRLLVLIVGTGCVFGQTPSGPDARSLTNSGVQAFKAARYPEAVQLFERAAAADPSSATARLYLATAIMSQHVPGDMAPANVALADRAEREFESVLTLEPKNVIALQSLASLAYARAQGPMEVPDRVRHLEAAGRWYQRVIEVQPANKEGHYSLGVISWARVYPDYMRAKKESGMRPDDPGPISNTNLRLELRNRDGQTVEAGMEHLNKALKIDPNYDDALAYMNLLYRIRADMSETAEDYRQHIAKADEFVAKALQIKRNKAGATSGTLVAAPPPPAPGAGVPNQIRVGGAVQAVKLIDGPKPVYPPTATEARIQGVVRFNAIVGKDGSVQNFTLISGHPLLVPAAAEAVRQYRYQPTLLNGVPVDVITQIDVPFTL